MYKIKYYQNDFLDQARKRTDPLADAAIKSIFESGRAADFRSIIQSLDHNNYSLPNGLPLEVKDFFDQSRQLPQWADVQLIQKGQKFFRTHATSLTFMLALMSLPYDYAAADGAQVLWLSKRMRDDTGKRLLETGKYVFDVASPEGFSAKGSAIASAQKVRLIHATIRYHILKKGDWNNVWGMPINQEDMAGTNLSMSLIPVRGMRKLGIKVSKDESEAYIHLWNVASYIMGVEEKLLPDTSKEAFLLNKMITERHFKPSEAGKGLTKALLSYMRDTMDARLKTLAPQYMRFLLGEKVADILDIPYVSLPEGFTLSPLKYWNQLRSLMNAHPDTYFEALHLFNSNVRKQEGAKVSMKIPVHLS